MDVSKITEGENFSFSEIIAQTFLLAFVFVIGLSLNNALELTFKAIPIGSSNSDVLSAWVYVVIVLPVLVILIFLIFKIFQQRKRRLNKINENK